MVNQIIISKFMFNSVRPKIQDHKVFRRAEQEVLYNQITWS